MRRSALKLNEDKTEFVIFSTKNNLRDNQCLVVGKDKIEVSEYVKILGVTFDNRMTLQKHITNICRSVNIHIRKINSIRTYLSNTAVGTLVQSIVIARLDYCNSVCIGLPMNRLQRPPCTDCSDFFLYRKNLLNKNSTKKITNKIIIKIK